MTSERDRSRFLGTAAAHNVTSYLTLELVKVTYADQKESSSWNLAECDWSLASACSSHDAIPVSFFFVLLFFYKRIEADGSAYEQASKRKKVPQLSSLDNLCWHIKEPYQARQVDMSSFLEEEFCDNRAEDIIFGGEGYHGAAQWDRMAQAFEDCHLHHLALGAEIPQESSWLASLS